MGASPKIAPPANAPSASAPAVLSAVHRFFETSLYLMLLTGVLTLIATGKIDPVTTAIALAGLLHKGWRWWRRFPPELSEPAAKRLTIGYLFFLPVDFLFVSMTLAQESQNQPLFAALLAVIHLLVFTMIVRLYSARITRDYMFLAMVGFAQVLVSAILTIDTTFLIFLMIFLVLCISTFMGLELRRSAEGAAAPPLASGTPAAKRLNRALSMTTAGLSVGAVLFAGMIFVLLPRVTAGFLSSYNFQPTLMSGFADGDVRLGQIGQIKQNPAVVMRVKALRGQIGMGYWRGDALTNFDGARWFTPSHPTRVVERSEFGLDSWYYVGWEGMDRPRLTREEYRQIVQRRERHNAKPVQVTYRVFLEPIGSDMIFMATQGMAVRGTFAPGVEMMGRRRRPGFLNVDATSSVSNPAHNYGRMVYEAQSLKSPFPAGLLREAATEFPAEIKQRYLQLPELDARIAQLAQQLTATAPTQYDKVLAIARHLRTKYTYSLELSGESLPGFLFHRKAGHCEYFATAMAVMLRTVGIPTRYARGFMGGEYNDVGEDWIVRARDAHSWVEVYFPNIGWVTFDPTPPAPTGVRGFLHRLSLYWDWAELMWIDWVVNYNFQQQNALMQNTQRQSIRWRTLLADWSRGTYRDSVAWVAQFRRQLIRFAGYAPRSLALLITASTALVLYLANRRALLEWLAVRFGVRIGQGEETRLVTLYYLQMLAVLERFGLKKQPWQTAREFMSAVRMAPFASRLVEPVERITVLFEAARYGSAPNLPQLASSLALLKAAARTAR